MGLFRAMDITASGLYASRTLMNVAASNLANANTTRSVNGGPYQRKNVVLGSASLEPEGSFQDRISQALRSVQVVGVEADGRPPRTVYDPGHPDADSKGIVKLPNVNMIEEMVDMITASRAYEAGVNAMESIKAMANKALAIGR